MQSPGLHQAWSVPGSKIRTGSEPGLVYRTKIGPCSHVARMMYTPKIDSHYSWSPGQLLAPGVLLYKCINAKGKEAIRRSRKSGHAPVPPWLDAPTGYPSGPFGQHTPEYCRSHGTEGDQEPILAGHGQMCPKTTEGQKVTFRGLHGALLGVLHCAGRLRKPHVSRGRRQMVRLGVSMSKTPTTPGVLT